jgi:hypothetical protein
VTAGEHPSVKGYREQRVSRLRTLRIIVPIALAALELSHPTWSPGAVSPAVVAAGSWWLVLHVLVLLGYGALVWLLWIPAILPRVALVAFLLCNSAFLGVDGIGVGLLTQSDPGEADRLWTSSFVTALADLAGLTWAASLLCVAASLTKTGRGRLVSLALGLTWLTFIASAPPLAVPVIISRVAAAATGASVIYRSGSGAVPFALLVFAAVLRQHVGPEAALGMLLVGIALAWAPGPERG